MTFYCCALKTKISLRYFKYIELNCLKGILIVTFDSEIIFLHNTPMLKMYQICL